MKVASKLLLLTLLLVIILVMSACVGQKGASNYYLNKYPEKLADLCNQRFPVTETFKPGKPVIIRNTIKGDSIPCPQPVVNSKTGELKSGKVKCPDSTIDTVIIRDTIKLENTARVFVLQHTIKELEGKLKNESSKLEKANRDKDDLEKQISSLKSKLFTHRLVIAGFTLILFILIILVIKSR